MQSNLTEVRPFRLEVPQGEIDELRRRIDATRWPTRELVTDRSQGVQLAAIQNLARYWTTEYDWRRCEARLNALPQFKTEIDGLGIHFIHVESAHERALPLIMTHGWSQIQMADGGWRGQYRSGDRITRCWRHVCMRPDRPISALLFEDVFVPVGRG
jgi:Epoxide hydrolase N terminus